MYWYFNHKTIKTMQNLFNNKNAVNGSQPLAVGKEPVGDFPCEKKVLKVLQVL